MRGNSQYKISKSFTIPHVVVVVKPISGGWRLEIEVKRYFPRERKIIWSLLVMRYMNISSASIFETFVGRFDNRIFLSSLW